MSDLIGLQVREVDLPEAALLTASELTNTGVVGLFERGILNKPVRCSSDVQVRERFGEPASGQLGIIGIRELFVNAQPYGLNVYPSRVLGDNSVTALAAALATNQLKMKSLRRVADAPVVVWITVEAGTNAGIKITFEDDDAAPTVTEVYDDIIVENLINQINYGIGGPGQSTLAKVEIYSDVLPTIVVQTAFILDSGTGDYYHDEETAAAATSILSAGQLGSEDPGVWANIYGFKFTSDASAPAERALEIYKLIDGVYTLVGTPFTGLTNDNWVARINEEFSGSKYVYVSTSGNLPVVSDDVIPMATGDDGDTVAMSDLVGTSAATSGIYAFKSTPIQVITSFDLYDSAISDDFADFAAAADIFAETVRERAIAVISVPEAWTIDEMEFNESTNGVKIPSLLRPKSWLALYTGWGMVDDEKGGRVALPASASLIGSGWIRKMFDNGGLPHIAPAGHGALIRNFSSMDIESYNSTDLKYVTHVLGVNVVMQIPGVGYIPRTSRLMATVNKNYDIHKRRVMHYLGDTFESGLGYIEQSPNTPDTRKQAVQTIDFTLQPLYNKGMFDPSNGYEGAVAIKADEENNTEDDVLNRRLNILVAIRIVGVIEVAYLNIANVERTLTITEA